MSLGFVIIARDAGPALKGLAQDIAAHAQDGDEVIWIDDTGPAADPHLPHRIIARAGWHTGVRVEVIVTGARGTGDTGTAINLALQAARAPRVILLPGAARLGAGFAQARQRAEAEDLDLITGPRNPNGPEAWGQMIFRRSLLPDRPAAEGQDSGGPLPLLHALHRTATRTAQHTAPIAHLPPPEPLTPHWLALWGQLAAENLPWALSLLPDRLSGLPVGARAVLGAGLAQHLPHGPLPDVPGAEIAQEARTKGPEAFRMPLPKVQRRAPLRLHLAGPHAHRMPFSYPALAPLWGDLVQPVQDPAKADLVLYAHPRDVPQMAPDIARALDTDPAKRLAILSEEPFWDTLDSPDPLAEEVTIDTPLGSRVLPQRNHHTSPVFDFDRIPYFLLTDERFAARYAERFARNAALTPQDWADTFAARPLDAAFMAERRPEAFHDMAHPAGAILGLCAWRTRLACAAPGRVARLGASWQAEVPSRLGLDDWHAAKLRDLDGQARLISGLENTHQPTYISEKLFDAFACGARPLYMAGPAHRLHGIGLPEGAWVNLWGLTSDAAAEALAKLRFDAAFFADYAQAQQHLARLWTAPDILTAERRRLAQALAAEITLLAR